MLNFCDKMYSPFLYKCIFLIYICIIYIYIYSVRCYQSKLTNSALILFIAPVQFLFFIITHNRVVLYIFSDHILLWNFNTIRIPDTGISVWGHTPWAWLRLFAPWEPTAASSHVSPPVSVVARVALCPVGEAGHSAPPTVSRAREVRKLAMPHHLYCILP